MAGLQQPIPSFSPPLLPAAPGRGELPVMWLTLAPRSSLIVSIIMRKSLPIQIYINPAPQDPKYHLLFLSPKIHTFWKSNCSHLEAKSGSNFLWNTQGMWQRLQPTPSLYGSLLSTGSLNMKITQVPFRAPAELSCQYSPRPLRRSAAAADNHQAYFYLPF